MDEEEKIKVARNTIDLEEIKDLLDSIFGPTLTSFLMPVFIKNLRLANLSSDPSDAVTGQIAVVNGELKIFDGADWVIVGSNVSFTASKLEGEYTATEAISAFKVVRPTRPTLVYQANAGTGQDNPVVGATDTVQKEMIAVRFTVPTGGGEINVVSMSLKKVGSPADNYVVDIQADSSGVPSGTALFTSNNLAASGVSTSYSAQVFSFSTPVILPAGSYWVVLRRSGGNDNSNYLSFQTTNISTAAPPVGDGSFAARVNGSWTAFQVSAPTPNESIHYIGGTSGEILKASALTEFTSGAIGVLDEALSASQTGTVVTHGVLDGFSGLTPGEVYYLDSSGGLSLTPGTQTVKIGVAITATKMFISIA